MYSTSIGSCATVFGSLLLTFFFQKRTKHTKVSKLSCLFPKEIMRKNRPFPERNDFFFVKNVNSIRCVDDLCRVDEHSISNMSSRGKKPVPVAPVLKNYEGQCSCASAQVCFPLGDQVHVRWPCVKPFDAFSVKKQLLAGSDQLASDAMEATDDVIGLGTWDIVAVVGYFVLILAVSSLVSLRG